MNLKVDSVFHQFGGKLALSDVYLRIEQGEVVGLLGRNGAGKSTLYKVLFGLLKNTSVRFRVDDQPCASLYDRKLIQYLPEQPQMPGDLSLSSLFDFYKLALADRQLVLDELEVHDGVMSKTLSMGKRKYFESLVLLKTDVPFLLMDEPFNGLSPIWVERMAEHIREATAKKGILITDHLYKPVLALADRLLYIESGILKQIHDREELIQYGYLPS